MPNSRMLYGRNEHTLTVIGARVHILKQPAEDLISAPPLNVQSLINIGKAAEKSVGTPSETPPQQRPQQVHSVSFGNIRDRVSIYTDRYLQIQRAERVEDFVRLLQRAGHVPHRHGTRLSSAHAQKYGVGAGRVTVATVQDADCIVDARKIYIECFQSHFDRLKCISTRT